MIKKTAIAFATSILLGAGASLTALPAVAADAPVKAEQVKSLPNIAILATGGYDREPRFRLAFAYGLWCWFRPQTSRY